MGIKNVKLDQTGLEGVKPRFVYIDTDDTVAAVQAGGYLNKLKENYGFSLDEKMMALVSTKASPSSVSSELYLFDVSKSGSNWSLVGDVPSHYVKYAGKENDGGGSATITITVTGALASDLAFAQVEASTNAVSVQKVTPSADTITVLLSGDPGASTVITYEVLRAAS